MALSTDRKPRVGLGFNSLTGAREFVVIEPYYGGFINRTGEELRAIHWAHVLSRRLNEERQCSISAAVQDCS